MWSFVGFIVIGGGGGGGGKGKRGVEMTGMGDGGVGILGMERVAERW